jgi:hypothetical protein
MQKQKINCNLNGKLETWKLVHVNVFAQLRTLKFID